MSERENFFEIAYSVKNIEETRAMYDRWAELYDEDLQAGDYAQPNRCAVALRGQTEPEGTSVLDVGCGTGLSGIALTQVGFQAIDGCDLSQGMLDKAAGLGVYGRLFACDLNQPPLDAADEIYDAVTAVGVFSFGHVMPDAVDEMLRVLKPGGTLIIGLNDHYYEEGALTAKLDALEGEGRLEILAREHGEHIPANDLKGWVLTTRKPI